MWPLGDFCLCLKFKTVKQSVKFEVCFVCLFVCLGEYSVVQVKIKD